MIKKIVGRLVKQEMVKLLITHLMTEGSKTCSIAHILIATFTVH